MKREERVGARSAHPLGSGRLVLL